MNEQKVRWLCRRGMKELDVMLERYLERRWSEAPVEERERFVAMLDLQDPVLWDLLLTRTTTEDPGLADVISRVRSLSGL